MKDDLVRISKYQLNSIISSFVHDIINEHNRSENVKKAKVSLNRIFFSGQIVYVFILRDLTEYRTYCT